MWLTVDQSEWKVQLNATSILKGKSATSVQQAITAETAKTSANLTQHVMLEVSVVSMDCALACRDSEVKIASNAHKDFTAQIAAYSVTQRPLAVAQGCVTGKVLAFAIKVSLEKNVRKIDVFCLFCEY